MILKTLAIFMLALASAPAVAQEPSLEQEAQAVLAAERAFDAAAEHDGQWTAFRAFAASEATMFTPQPVNAQEWLSGRTDPAHSVRWQPHAVYISCDATLAVTTGAWQRANGSFGYFTTVWRKQSDGGWKWVLDHGDELTAARVAPETPIMHLPNCGGVWPRLNTLLELSPAGQIAAADRSLHIMWGSLPNDGHRVKVMQGRSNRVLHDIVPASVPAP